MYAPIVNNVETDWKEPFKEKTREMQLLFEELVSASQVVATTTVKERTALLSESASEKKLGIYPFELLVFFSIKFTFKH